MTPEGMAPFSQLLSPTSLTRDHMGTRTQRQERSPYKGTVANNMGTNKYELSRCWLGLPQEHEGKRQQENQNRPIQQVTLAHEYTLAE